MNTDQIQTVIRTLPACDEQAALDILSALMTHFPPQSFVGDCLLDCFMGIEGDLEAGKTLKEEEAYFRSQEYKRDQVAARGERGEF